METKYISNKTIDIINRYKNISIGSSTCSVPYFNNKVTATKGALRAEVGKGSPEDIHNEIENIIRIQKIDKSNINSENLKKILVDNNIGIDCSGFAYHILNTESISRNKGQLNKHINFTNAKSLFRKIRAKMLPEKNVDVITFTDNKNSQTISMKDTVPGSIITMTSEINNGDRNHILIIYKIDYENSIPKIIYYIHSIAWPTDGQYNHGIHEGKIEITDPNKSLIDQRWVENNEIGDDNYTFLRARKSNTELRKLNWF